MTAVYSLYRLRQKSRIGIRMKQSFLYEVVQGALFIAEL